MVYHLIFSSNNKNMDSTPLPIPEALYQAAKEAFNAAYAPYSKFQVGAALLTKSGDIIKGCNVENASYGLTVCAERNCISNAVVNGQQQFSIIAIYTEQDKLTPPCGACRQVIAEFFEPNALVVSVNHKKAHRTWQLQEVLPDAFTGKDL